MTSETSKHPCQWIMDSALTSHLDHVERQAVDRNSAQTDRREAQRVFAREVEAIYGPVLSAAFMEKFNLSPGPDRAEPTWQLATWRQAHQGACGPSVALRRHLRSRSGLRTGRGYDRPRVPAAGRTHPLPGGMPGGVGRAPRPTRTRGLDLAQQVLRGCRGHADGRGGAFEIGASQRRLLGGR